MINRFQVPPLAESTRLLADVASGRRPPELLITGARILSTYSERIIADREILIAGGRIAAIQPAGLCGDARATYDVGGGIMAPGLVDPHLHIESSMVSACAYAEAALLNGTTTIFCDSHEIGNVLGVEGIEYMLEDARQAPLSIFLTVPSTVPATTSAWETAGGELDAAAIAGLFDRWPEAVALGEKMDFVQIAAGDAFSHAIVAEALKRGRPVCGHIYGREFVAAYAASGITDTHEAIDREIANDFIEAGLWVFLRGGPPTTPWHSLPLAIRAITELGASPKRVCICTDDRDADDLFAFGLDWVARQAVAAGCSPALAWSMGSLHPATRYAMDGEFGGLGHSRRADLVLLGDDLVPRNTWYGGELLVEDRTITPQLEQALEARYRYPARAYRTVQQIGKPPLIPELPTQECLAHAIRTELPGIILFHETIRLPRYASWPELLEAENLCFVTVVERHGKHGQTAHGLLKNFGLREGAVASSVGHDAHNIIIAGTTAAEMQVALDYVLQAAGGVCAVRGGQVLAGVPLPIAGLMSDERIGTVAAQMVALKTAWSSLGCTLPYMGFNLIPLSVIPEIRITDQGLVLVPSMANVPLFESL